MTLLCIHATMEVAVAKTRNKYYMTLNRLIYSTIDSYFVCFYEEKLLIGNNA